MSTSFKPGDRVRWLGMQCISADPEKGFPNAWTVEVVPSTEGDDIFARHVADPRLGVHDRPERFRRFCRDCGEDIPHDGFDEFGAGWYAQICRCRYCGEQGMKVWPLAWW